MQDDKNKQNTHKYESNAERDQDEGQMNNGTLGGDMGVIGGSSNNQRESGGSEEPKSGSQNNDDRAGNPHGNNE